VSVAAMVQRKRKHICILNTLTLTLRLWKPASVSMAPCSKKLSALLRALQHCCAANAPIKLLNASVGWLQYPEPVMARSLCNRLHTGAQRAKLRACCACLLLTAETARVQI
jgi:hypothetical protein